VFQKQVADSKAHAATPDEINELLARTEEELELFGKWDEEATAAAAAASEAAGEGPSAQGSLRGPLMGPEEVPEWVTAAPKQEMQVGGGLGTAEFCPYGSELGSRGRR
jgi:hypothetical protein